MNTVFCIFNASLAAAAIYGPIPQFTLALILSYLIVPV